MSQPKLIEHRGLGLMVPRPDDVEVRNGYTFHNGVKLDRVNRCCNCGFRAINDPNESPENGSDCLCEVCRAEKAGGA